MNINVHILCLKAKCHCCDLWPGRWWQWRWRPEEDTGGFDGSTSAGLSRRAVFRRPHSGQNVCTDPGPSRLAGSPAAACGDRWLWLVGNCWSVCCSSEKTIKNRNVSFWFLDFCISKFILEPNWLHSRCIELNWSKNIFTLKYAYFHMHFWHLRSHH